MTVSTSIAQQPSAKHSLGQEPLETPNVYLSAGAGRRPTSSVPNTQRSSLAPKARGATASISEQTPQSPQLPRLAGCLSAVEEESRVRAGVQGGAAWVYGNKGKAAPTAPLGEPRHQHTHGFLVPVEGQAF